MKKKETISIRHATDADIPQLRIFEQDLIAHEQNVEPSIRQDITFCYYELELMINQPDNYLLLVAVNQDGLIVGSGYGAKKTNPEFCIEKIYGYLGFLYVMPEYRGQGIIRKIISALKEWFCSKNISEIRLEVYGNNTGAIKAYKRLGFRTYTLDMKLEN